MAPHGPVAASAPARMSGVALCSGGAHPAHRIGSSPRCRSGAMSCRRIKRRPTTSAGCRSACAPGASSGEAAGRRAGLGTRMERIRARPFRRARPAGTHPSRDGSPTGARHRGRTTTRARPAHPLRSVPGPRDSCTGCRWSAVPSVARPRRRRRAAHRPSGPSARPPAASSARAWAGTVLAMVSQEPKNPDSGAVPQAVSIMALTPPQRACPNTTTCDTPSVLTPYSSAARTLSPRPPPASQGGTRLATLRTVKTSPGPVERQALPSRGYRQDRAGGLVTGNLPFGSADHLPHVGKPAAYRGGSPQVLDAAVGANTPYVGILLWGSM